MFLTHHRFKLTPLLLQEKQEKNMSMFSSTSQKRWFKVHTIGPPTKPELALCYYKNPTSKEPKGWFFLHDVISLTSTEKSICIKHPAREFNLRAPTQAEHQLWWNGLQSLCSTVKKLRDQENVNPAHGFQDNHEKYGEDDARRWSKGGEVDDEDFRRQGMGEDTEKNRKERAAKRAQRRAERQQRRGDPSGEAEVENEREELRDDREPRYGAPSNRRVSDAILRGSEENDDVYDRRAPPSPRYDRDSEYEESGPVVARGQEEETAVGREETKEEAMQEEEDDLEETKESSPKPDNKRKKGQFKFGTGFTDDPEFDKALEQTPDSPEPDKPMTRSEMIGEPVAELGMNGGGMEEMTLAEGDRAGRRLSAGRAFGADTPAKGALSASNRSNKSEECKDDSGVEESKGDETPRDKRTAMDDEDFWGVQANEPDDSFLGKKSSIDGVSFRFDSDSDDEEVDLEEERLRRRRAVEEAERIEEEERARNEEKQGDNDDGDNDMDNGTNALATPTKDKKKKKKKKSGPPPPSGPPPGKSSKMGPPPTMPPPRQTGLTPDKNFVDEDWDSSPSPTNRKSSNPRQNREESKEERPVGIKADVNFVEEDWDS